MQTTFEKIGGTYRQEGDYLLPNIEVPESQQIGIWGQWRLQYIHTNKKVLYTTTLINGTLKGHLEEVDQSADEMFNLWLHSLRHRNTMPISKSKQCRWWMFTMV